MAFATRGDFAAALYSKLGFSSPTGSGKFSDSGDLDAITTTLADVGITNGIGGGAFGTSREITRGEAFTMIARALGLVGPNSTVEEGAQALVSAGIVKGYGGDPNNIGINDPLQPEHMGLLMDRMGPELDKPADATNPGGGTVRDRILGTADEKRSTNTAESDPTFAAYLAELGVEKENIQTEIDLRTEIFNLSNERMTERSQALAEDANEGIGSDFENRGLYRSGTRQLKQAESDEDFQTQLDDALFTARNEYEAWKREQEQRISGIDAELGTKETESEAKTAAEDIEDDYDYYAGN